jgi:hypothetical protein
MSRYLPAITGAVLLLIAGLVHGFMTDRWRVSPALTEAAGRLKQVPLTVGDWQGEDLDIRRRETEAITGHLDRRYVNRSTGCVVTISLISGKPGPVSIHTPDVCYRAGGFDVAPPTRVAIGADRSGASGDFLYADLNKKTAAEHIRQRIFWAWTADGQWKVPDNPRDEFASQPVLYKLYVIRDVNVVGEAVEDDPCADLIRQLVPQLRKALFPQS